MAERHGRDERAQPDPLSPRRQRRQRRYRIVGRSVTPAHHGEVVIGAEEPIEARALSCVGERQPLVPGDVLLALDHQAEPHAPPS